MAVGQKVTERIESDTYYGTYSLEKWIKLMLSKRITLPEYQRYFVWSEEQARAFIKSIAEDMYIPLVTIARYNNARGEIKNLIIDGQQRLTSLLLAYLGLFPRQFKIVGALDEDLQNEANMQEWNYTQLPIANGVISKGKIQEFIGSKHYSKFEINGVELNEEFLKNKYIDFAYIVPRTEDAKAVKKFFANMFFTINSGGTKLTRYECRKALYSLGDDISGVFEPEFAANMKVNKQKIDLVRLIALASNYAEVGKDNVSRGYDAENAREPLYDEFIRDYVAGRLAENDKFKDITNLPERVQKLGRTLEQLNLKKDCSSIIMADIYYVGAVYYIVVEGKDIENGCEVELKKDLDQCIKKINETDYHRKNPGVLKYLRERIDKSIDVYKDYLNERKV